MSQKKPFSTPYTVATTAVFTALVCVATIIFSIYVPETRGFFNIGETMVYIAALLFGPVVGGIAGGVGSMFADIILGYSVFAPATLVTKASEGIVVGFLGRRAPKVKSKTTWRLYTVLIGLVPGALLGVIGSTYYIGSVELYLGIFPAQSTTILSIPPVAWYIMGALVTAFIILIGFVSEAEVGWTILSVIAGGLVMVTGYYLYEQFFMGVFALAEVPVNIGQMTVGLAVALPVVRVVYKYLPSLKGSAK